MLELKDDIWNYADKGWIVVTTNNVVKRDGEAVMGAGIALEAARRFPALPKELAERMKSNGHRIHYFQEYGIVAYPTKFHWKDKSDLNLIIAGAVQLKADVNTFRYQQRPVKYYLPRLGCGNGGLEWHNVAKAVQPYLDEPEFIFVSK